MLICIYILLEKLLSISSYEYEILEILPLERKTLFFNKTNNYHIVKYSHFCPYRNNTTIMLRMFTNVNYDIYLYNKKENISDKNGIFQNYIYHYNMKNYLFFQKMNKSDYYIVIQYSNDFKTDITIYSSDMPIEINTNLIYNEFYNFRGTKTLNYIFKIHVNNTKFARFGVIDLTHNGLTILTIKDESNTFISQKYFRSNESYIKLKNDTTYNFNYTLYFASYEWFYDIESVEIFLMLSNYSNYIYVEKDKNESDIFSFINKIDLILNISSIKKRNKLIFEYNRDFNNYNVEFSAIGYNTDDIDSLPELSGKPLEITKDKNCSDREM